ncbi:TVP38/TMEM64 family protein [Rathayibacter soli]|uniref:TVP38/TMEM64 family protein n=1 Tax=Rathayibacter soli TaxID=3144168 RepID=UPI0027E49B7A|nr:TVP38/TMEM64 family protein [Glaciibacter superstes]
MRERGRRWSGRSVLWRLVALIVFVIAATLIGVFVPLPAVNTLRSAVTSAGLLGAIGFVLGYALTTLAPVPKAVLSILAGLIWGFWVGAITVYIGALLGAACAFFLGRWLGREAIERFTGTRVARVDDLLRRRGFLAVLGARLVPVIPFTAINYVAGLTAVRRRDYALGTAVGIIPGDMAYVAIGAYGLQLGWEFWIAVGGLGALTIGGALVGIRARRRSETATIQETSDDHV